MYSVNYAEVIQNGKELYYRVSLPDGSRRIVRGAVSNCSSGDGIRDLLDLDWLEEYMNAAPDMVDDDENYEDCSPIAGADKRMAWIAKTGLNELARWYFGIA